LDTYTTLGKYIEQDFLVAEERRTRISTKPLSWGTFTARRGRLLNWLVKPNVCKSPFLKANAVYALAHTFLGKLTPDHLEAYFDVLLDGQTSWEIRFQLRTDFGMIFDRAEDLIAVAPSRLLKGVGLERKPDVHKDLWDVQSVLRAIEDHTKPILPRALVGFEFYMMNRPSETFALTWGDFTADLRHVDFTKASRRTAEGEAVTPGLKTKSRRTVRVPAALVVLLQELRKEQRTKGAGWSEADRVFLTNTGLPFSKDRFAARWQGFRKLLGLASGPTYYSLKSTGNNALAEAGVTPEARADRMGHSDSRMALKTYRRVSTTEGDRVADVFDALRRGA
jgi:integrase